MLNRILIEDYKRYNLPKVSLGTIWFTFVSQPIPGLKFITIFRLAQYFRRRNRLMFFFFILWLRKYKVKYGFDISYRANIGKGLYIGHFGNVVIHGDAVIGDYCNISQGITIGISNYGDKKGVPIIGNKVFIGPNAGVYGNIIIGNNVVIGANSVVTDDVDDFKTVLAPKPLIIDKDLSSYYIQNINE
ncbi:serine O-acetyltransferase [Flavobacterium sp.]|jgi:serine O-acetyltransferase|uniref:serine O-acetyltransferase n=1 Tax=Flavobacterium sp. TaxID=239 RepID=UPI0035B339BB